MQKRLINILLMAFGLAQSFVAAEERDIDHSRERLEFRSADNNFSVGFTGYLQQNNYFRYMPATGGGESSKDLKLELNAARIGFYGSAFHPALTYFIQTGFEKEPARSMGSRNNDGSSGYLRDYYLNFEAHKHAQLRIGKFGMPFSRQAMVNGSQMQFHEAMGASSSYFLLNGNGKDVGIMVHNGRNQPIEWALAVVSNGLVARLGYNHGGIDGYQLTDFAGGPLRFAVAVNGYAQEEDFLKFNMDNLTGGADFLVKAHHFSTNGAFSYNYKKAGTAAGNHAMSGGLDLGYLLAERHEPVLRYSWTKLNDLGSINEVLAGYNYYIYGQHLKIQAYAGAAFSDRTQWKAGAQFQFAL